MAREWQPESRPQTTEEAPESPNHAVSPEPGRAADPASAPARGPGGTTGWLRGGDSNRRSEAPAEQTVDPEAVTNPHSAVATREERPRPEASPTHSPEPAISDPPYEDRGRARDNAAADHRSGEPHDAARDGGEADGPEDWRGDPVLSPSPDEGRWRRLIGGSSGGGPLSEDRVAREQAQQTPPGGENGAQASRPGALRDRQDTDVAPGGTMDPNTRMRRIAEQISRGDRDPYTAEAYGDEEEEEAAREGLARGGPLVWLIDHWKAIALPLGALCMMTFVVATVDLPDLGGGGEVASSEGSPSGKDAARAPSGSGSERAPLYDSGLSFAYTEKEDETVLLTAGGDLEWTGRVEQVSKQEVPKGDKAGSAAAAAVEVLRLSGPTAAEVGPGYTMDSGSENPGEVTTTVFAVEGEGVPDMHATFHLFGGESATGATQRANGSYDVTADSGELIADGNYSDHRTGAAGGREVIRTYTEQVPGESGYRQFRVRYEAAEGVPIPLLVGWQTPDKRPEDLKLEGGP